MKNLLLISLLIMAIQLNAQSSGNVNYEQLVILEENNIQLAPVNKDKNSVSIKGMANVKADSYVATFSLIQLGKSMKQTDSLTNHRLNTVKKLLNDLDSVTLFIDMVSFVPLYDIVFEKKLFSKNSYNEIPDGFEMKKNLHIHFKSHEQLSSIISFCAVAEIYNLIKVDYYASNLDEIKLQLQSEARKKLKVRMEHYRSILGPDFDSTDKQISDGYKVVYPVERYQKINAYNNNAFKFKSMSQSNKNEKHKTNYYQAIVNKEFDFVLNPVVIEPVIQVLYEIKVSSYKKDEKKEMEYLLVTPNGDVKSIL